MEVGLVEILIAAIVLLVGLGALFVIFQSEGASLELLLELAG
ncbi:MAG: hypothetical protein ACOCQL_01000 [Halolamina sp.]